MKVDSLGEPSRLCVLIVAILIIRTYALFERSRRVLVLILFVGLGSLAIVGMRAFYKLASIDLTLSLSVEYSVWLIEARPRLGGICFPCWLPIFFVSH